MPKKKGGSYYTQKFDTDNHSFLYYAKETKHNHKAQNAFTIYAIHDLIARHHANPNEIVQKQHRSKQPKPAVGIELRYLPKGSPKRAKGWHLA